MLANEVLTSPLWNSVVAFSNLPLSSPIDFRLPLISCSCRENDSSCATRVWNQGSCSCTVIRDCRNANFLRRISPTGTDFLANLEIKKNKFITFLRQQK